jgi:ribonuclease P protein component
MPDIRRLKTRREFLRVAAARRKRVRPGLIVQAARRKSSPSRPASPPPRQGPSAEASGTTPGAVRVGFTASRKVGKAVDRNRALPALGEAGTDYVLVARKATLARPYEDLVRDLHEALIQLGKHGADNGGAPRPCRKPSSRGRASPQGDRR